MSREKTKSKNEKQESSPAEQGESSPSEDRVRQSYRRIIIYLSVFAVLAIGIGGSTWGYRLYIDHQIKELVKECEAARSEGDWAGLEIKARQLIVLDPDNYRYKLYLATAFQEVGANVELKKILAMMPEDAPPPVFAELSRLQYRSGEVLDAMRNFRKIIKIEPKSVKAHEGLSICLAMLRQREELMQEARRAIRDGAAINVSYIYLIGADWMTFTNGYQKVTKWAKNYPEQAELFEVAAANHLLIAGSDQSEAKMTEEEKTALSDSLKLISDLRKKYPENREMLALEISYHIHRGNAETVGGLLNKAASELSEDSRFWRFKGWFNSHIDEWEAAEKDYLKCLELNPFDWQCRHELSAVYRQLEKPEQLKEMVESAALGKEVMRGVLQSDSTATVPFDVMKQILEYLRVCGEPEVAESLSRYLYGVRR